MSCLFLVQIIMDNDWALNNSLSLSSVCDCFDFVLKSLMIHWWLLFHECSKSQCAKQTGVQSSRKVIIPLIVCSVPDAMKKLRRRWTSSYYILPGFNNRFAFSKLDFTKNIDLWHNKSYLSTQRVVLEVECKFFLQPQFILFLNVVSY